MHATIAAVCLAGVFAAPASASAPALHVKPTLAHHGTVLKFTGRGCRSGDTVFLISRLFPGHAYGIGAISVRAGAGGHFTKRFRVRATTRAGRYGVTARCGGGNLGLVVFVRVR